MKRYSLLFAALLALGACKDKKDEGSDAPKAGKAGEVDKGAADKGAATGDSAEPAAAAGKASTLTLANFGLAIDVPAGTKESALGDSVMLQGPGLVASVDAASDFDPKTFAEVDEDLEMYTPLNLVKTEVEGGWDVTFENKGGMGTNYWVQVRRVIDGKHYKCGTTASSKEQQDAALKACQSLRKAE